MRGEQRRVWIGIGLAIALAAPGEALMGGPGSVDMAGQAALPGSGEAGATEAVRRLTGEIEGIRKTFPGEMAVYMKNLATGDEIGLDADRVMETYSVIKIPIMVEVLRRVERGDFSLAERMTVRAEDKRLGSGILATFDAGLQPTVKDVLTFMIIVSDNTATDLLADKVGRANVTQTMHTLGLAKTSIEYSVLDDYRRWYELIDPAAPLATAEQVYAFPVDKYPKERVDEASWKLNDDPKVYFGHSTVREIGWLLEQMTRGTLVSKDASALMLEILKKQRVNDRFPKYVRGVKIAHKTGDDQPRVANDAGVIWAKDQAIVLVVFTGHHRGTTAGLHEAVGRVAAYVVKEYGGETAAEFKP
jgi:beta-lactamase class A